MMTAPSLTKASLLHHPSPRSRRRLARSGSEAEALRAFTAGMDELAPAQPFALYLLEQGRFEVAATSWGRGFVSFDSGCSLARYLRAHPHPVMTFGTRRARCLTRELDPEDAVRLASAGAVAVIPVLDEGRPVGFAVLAKRDASRAGASADPMAVAELTEDLALRLADLRDGSVEALEPSRGLAPRVVQAPLEIAG